MVKKYTTKQWIKLFGKQYGLQSEETLRQRCNETPIKGKIYPLPSPWKCLKEGRQYFLYKEEHDAKVIRDLKVIDPALKEFYLAAKIDDYTISRLVSMAREAIMTNKPKRLLLEFKPADLVRRKSSNEIEITPVEKLFDEHKKEIGNFKPDLYERLQSADYWHAFLHRQWLWLHIPNQRTNQQELTGEKLEVRRKEELQKVITKHIPSNLSEEVENRLWRHCIWCGRVKSAGKRRQAKYCEATKCGEQFKRWSKKIAAIKTYNQFQNTMEPDLHKQHEMIDNQMKKIRMVLAT